MNRPSASSSSRWPLPADDDWSTPFAELLLEQLDLRPGLTILDIACGHGIPAFYLAEQVGPTGSVLGIDASRGQVANARTIQRGELPWLRFECVDMRALPASRGAFENAYSRTLVSRQWATAMFRYPTCAIAGDRAPARE